jgi:hypothetical protein
MPIRERPGSSKACASLSAYEARTPLNPSTESESESGNMRLTCSVRQNYMSEIVCQCCGEAHSIEEAEGSFALPDDAACIGRIGRLFRVRANRAFCSLDRKRFFVRGLLSFPIREHNDEYCWGTWVEIDSSTFKLLRQNWDLDTRVNQTSCPGFLSNSIPPLGRTVGVPVSVTVQPIGTAPRIEVIDKSHPIAKEQSDGISMQRAVGFNHWVLHSNAQ